MGRSDDIDLSGMSIHKTHSFERKQNTKKNKPIETESSVDILSSDYEQNSKFYPATKFNTVDRPLKQVKDHNYGWTSMPKQMKPGTKENKKGKSKKNFEATDSIDLMKIKLNAESASKLSFGNIEETSLNNTFTITEMKGSNELLSSEEPSK